MTLAQSKVDKESKLEKFNQTIDSRTAEDRELLRQKLILVRAQEDKESKKQNIKKGMAAMSPEQKALQSAHRIETRRSTGTYKSPH